MRRYSSFIVIAALIALAAYALVITLTSREIASTIGIIYLVVLMTVSIVWDFAHRNREGRQ